jgi:hypothetical protein
MGYIREFFEKSETVPDAVHNKMLRLFREHIVVGGMPEVVSKFVETQNFGNVLKIQQNIIADYLDDIAKYAIGNDKAKAKECFHAIPRNLAKEYKKFQYSVVEKGGTSRKFRGSLEWLYDAGIINVCHNLSIPELPLKGNSKSDEFKVYMCDTGLLVAMLDVGTQKDIIDGNIGIYKGAIFENIIADIFTKADKELYYFAIPNLIEIDFFIRRNGLATAVEVKSSENTKSKSMTNIIGRYGVKHGIKLSTKNIGVPGTVEHLPLYMAMYICDEE